MTQTQKTSKWTHQPTRQDKLAFMSLHFCSSQVVPWSMIMPSSKTDGPTKRRTDMPTIRMSKEAKKTLFFWQRKKIQKRKCERIQLLASSHRRKRSVIGRARKDDVIGRTLATGIKIVSWKFLSISCHPFLRGKKNSPKIKIAAFDVKNSVKIVYINIEFPKNRRRRRDL